MVEHRQSFAVAVAAAEVETASSACEVYAKRRNQEPPPAPFRGTFWDDEDGNTMLPDRRLSCSLSSGQGFDADTSKSGDNRRNMEPTSHPADRLETLDGPNSEASRPDGECVLSGGTPGVSGRKEDVPINSCCDGDGGRPAERSGRQGSTYSDTARFGNGNAGESDGRVHGTPPCQDGGGISGIDGLNLPLEQLGKKWSLGA